MGVSNEQRSRQFQGDYTPRSDPTAFAALRNLSHAERLAERRGKDVRYLETSTEPCFILGQQPADVGEATDWMNRIASERNGLKLMIRPNVPVSWERTLRIRVMSERLREVTMARERLGTEQFAGTRRDQIRATLGEEPTTFALLSAVYQVVRDVLKETEGRGIDPKEVLSSEHRVTLGYAGRYLKRAQPPTAVGD